MAADKIVERGIDTEMKTAYIDYSMSVIVSRALPDVRDGLKPVHRRVLYGMSELGLASNRPYKKCARIVGEVLGKYHPHGDTAVYDTLVRMAQDWSLRHPLVDGQGNFGSIDGDNPAAMRYTEARLRAIAEAMLADLDKNTVDFVPNFDDSLTEPSVLPSAIPNLLVNGASGIAVGMATNMAPHNLGEVVAATMAYIDNPGIELLGLMQHVKGPDFPTGGTIYGVQGIHEAYATGRGRLIVRAKAEIETHKDRERIIVTEIPYQVNKEQLVEKIHELSHGPERKIEGISGIKDESARDVRIVIDLKREAVANVVLNNLYKHTMLEVSFSINNVCLVHGRPQTVNLKDLIRHFVDHRHEVVTRRTQYELDEALQRAHLLEGLIVALDNLDEVIATIRAARNPDEAKQRLMRAEGFDSSTLTAYLSRTDMTMIGTQPIEGGRFALSEMQAKAILDLRLQRLTGMEIEKIVNEHKDLLGRIAHYRDILANEGLRMQIIKDELAEVAKRFGDARRTVIEGAGDEITIEDMIADDDVVITISHQGYVKRTKLTEYRVQKRGGTGFKGTGTKEEDFVEHLFVATNHNYLLFFTERGKCYWLRVFEIPEGARAGKGRAIQNLIQLEPGDKVRTFIKLPNLSDPAFLKQYSIVMCTAQGTVKRTELEAYSRPRQAGINAINIVEGDSLVAASLCQDKSEIIIATSYGLANRFDAEDVREMGRTATGVRGIRLSGEDKDKVVGMVIVDDPATELLVVSEKGFGKRSPLDEYRKTNRGTQGVRTLNVTDKTGLLTAMVEVSGEQDLMIITQEGITIRLAVAEVRQTGRNAQGVRLIKLRDEDGIAAITRLDASVDDDVAAEGNGSAATTDAAPTDTTASDADAPSTQPE